MQKFPTISLDGAYEMALLMHSDYTALQMELNSMQSLKEHGVETFPAVVPGNFELDLQRAGKIPDPFYSSNIIDLQKFEYAHVFYSKIFRYTGLEENTTPVLLMEGVDTYADIYLNGMLIGHTENMLIPHYLDASSIREGENELFVHIYPTCLEVRKADLGAADNAMRYTFDSLMVRKAAHSFGWDIMPRAVSAGLWRSVSLLSIPEKYVKETYFYTTALSEDHSEAQCELFYHFDIGDDPLDGYTIRVKGVCGESVFEKTDRLWFTQGKLKIAIPEPKLWWPVGRGPQNLYQITVTLEYRGVAVAQDSFRTGVRTVFLNHTDVLDEEGKGEFVFVVNGEKVFIKGSNWVPADAYHSRDKDRIPRMLDLWTEIGCNALRSWGGGVYEDHQFYDICDEKGIIVWMDFCMGCGSYPQTPELAEAFGKEAEIIVKKLRHHPSLCLWAGDNENDYFMAYIYHTDPNLNVLTRKVLPDAIRRHDNTRSYLPSSPYVSPAAYAQRNDKRLPESHLWGPRDYFKSDFYRNAPCIFASEMGYHGCPSPDTLKKFIAPEQLDEKKMDTVDWLTHAASPDQCGPYAYRNNLMISHVKTLFGMDTPWDLDRFARASQISQAEAKKYFVERFRCKKWERTGVIWWNIIDGWPQVSDAIVDYFFTKKLAFSYLKRSQQNLCLMMDEPENGELSLIVSNDTRDDLPVSYQVYDMTNEKKLVAAGSAIAQGDRSACVQKLPYDGKAQTFYYITWESGVHSGTNHYLAGRPPYDLDHYLAIIHELGYDQFEGFEQK